MSTRYYAVERDEDGVALILALVFLLAIGIVTLAVSNFAVGASVNTVNARSEQTLIAGAESEASASIQAVRLSYTYPGCVPPSCVMAYGDGSTNPPTPPPAPLPCSFSAQIVPSLAVYCIGYRSPTSTATRVVDFYVCRSGGGVTASSCAASNSGELILYAAVTFDDIPPGVTAGSCTALSSTTCGLTMSIDSWDIRLADT